jgi:hypothetical protein
MAASGVVNSVMRDNIREAQRKNKRGKSIGDFDAHLGDRIKSKAKRPRA